MMFQRLTSDMGELFDQAFALYRTSFPEFEQRSLEKQRVLMHNTAYHLDLVLEDSVFAGLLAYWEFPGYAYIEHFAIHPDFRGKSLGSAVLREFCAERELVILEIDPPTDAISIRRENFYKKLGFVSNPYAHHHPAYQKRFTPHTLVAMSHPRELAQAEYDRFVDELKNVVMSDA